MDIRQQVARLVGVGVPARAGMGEDEFRALAGGLHGGGIVCVHPSLVPASVLAGLLERAGRPGFVVEDMTDLADFEPLDGLQVPERSLYLLHGVERGDDLRAGRPTTPSPRSPRAGGRPSPSARASAGCCRSPTGSSRTGASCASAPASAGPAASTRGPRRSGSAAAPAETAPRAGTPRRSVGAGPGTTTPGSASPRRRVARDRAGDPQAVEVGVVCTSMPAASRSMRATTASRCSSESQSMSSSAPRDSVTIRSSPASAMRPRSCMRRAAPT